MWLCHGSRVQCSLRLRFNVAMPRFKGSMQLVAAVQCGCATVQGFCTIAIGYRFLPSEEAVVGGADFIADLLPGDGIDLLLALLFQIGIE